MTLPANISAAIDAYEAGATVPAWAIIGLSHAELNAFPVPGTWSIQQIVVHLWESDLASIHRMRRVIAEDTPLLISYDETAAAKSLFYVHEDLGRVCRLFEDQRRLMAGVLRRLPAEAFERTGVHNIRGKVSLLEFVEMYVEHVRGHMTHLLKKRQLLGKPLTIEIP